MHAMPQIPQTVKSKSQTLEPVPTLFASEHSNTGGKI